MTNEILKVSGLKTHFHTRRGIVKAVDGVDFSLHPGEILGMVGESGCGKSITSLSILGLIQKPAGRIVDGEILFNGKNLLALSEKEMNNIRGRDISMIFQEPMTSLNPVYTIGEQISEVLRQHAGMNRKTAWKRGEELLDMVKMPLPKKRMYCYPHELSGGMRQRVMIAMALACKPSVLIADEPTTALDITIQAQILELILDLRKQTGTAILFITHDLGVVAELCDRMIVMYCGHVVEQGKVADVFADPRHPYTQGLLRSIPNVKCDTDTLFSIDGSVPSPFALPKGCSFAPRCRASTQKCTEVMPPLIEVEKDWVVRCNKGVSCV
ncbi:peptide ABC transporter ATP-binding protein [Bacteroidia bacterium]|nr:peptide ABC transporter ATP-binding protein [Bacteroidia bacterium]